jgi:putative ATP-dependent endonuclease of OLD family
MHKDISIKVKNYKCFGEAAQGFERILPINVIIGKNNSGKSSLIDIIQYSISPETYILSSKSNSNSPEVLITHKMSESTIKAKFPVNAMGGYIPGQSQFEYAKKYINTGITFQLSKDGKKFVSLEKGLDIPQLQPDFAEIVKQLENPLKGLTLYYITAERNIVPERGDFSNLEVNPNGQGCTNLVTQIVTSSGRDGKLIENLLLDELNKIVNPEISFIDIIPLAIGENYWEIFFETIDESRIALSKMGSGLKTILQVLINIIILPKINNKKYKNCIFAFEELENNLHPSMQRRLFNYLSTFTLQNDTTLFLTTHSNIVIDIFSNSKSSQIIHTKKLGEKVQVKSASCYQDNKQILNDLAVRSSDILQSNGIIWVEGPSDRNYINKWISLVDPTLKEGLHYTIMFYGGRLLSNLCFDYEWLQVELIPLLKINTNAFVVIDKDGKLPSRALNQTKTRIQNEISQGNCWITKGREIENYVSKATLERWLLNKHNIKAKIKIDYYEKIENILKKSAPDSKLQYEKSKTIYSGEIKDFITEEDLDILDLKQKLKSLVMVIKEWNS